MTNTEFLQKISALIEIAEPENITLETPLTEVREWDSVAVMTALNFFDENFSESPDIDDLFDCKTFQEIFNLVSKEQ